jgi:hypothetical protein
MEHWQQRAIKIYRLTAQLYHLRVNAGGSLSLSFSDRVRLESVRLCCGGDLHVAFGDVDFFAQNLKQASFFWVEGDSIQDLLRALVRHWKPCEVISEMAVDWQERAMIGDMVPVSVKSWPSAAAIQCCTPAARWMGRHRIVRLWPSLT